MKAPLVVGRVSDMTGKKVGNRRSAGLTMLLKLLLVLSLPVIYVEAPLPLTGSKVVPSFVWILLLMPILAVIYHRRVYKYEAVFVGQIAFVLLLTALLSPGLEYLDEKLLGLLQTVVSITGGILLLKLLGDLQGRWVARVLLILSIVLVAGAFFEVMGILKPVSDSFREATFGRVGFFVYEADHRDLEVTGFPRPNFFAAEPSFLAIGFFVFINSWLLLAYNSRNLAVTLLGTFVMFALVGSPVLVLSLASSLAIMLTMETRVSPFLYVITVTCIAALGVFYVQPDVFPNLIERIGSSIENAGTLRASSENRRLVFPYVTLVDVLRNSPVFGVGISGKEVVERYMSLPVEPEYGLGNNACAWFFIYTGLVGSLLFIKAFRDYWHRVRVGHAVLFIFLLLALSNALAGGIETPRFWGYTFLFIGVLKKASGTGERSAQPSDNERGFRYGRRRKRGERR